MVAAGAALFALALPSCRERSRDDTRAATSAVVITPGSATASRRPPPPPSAEELALIAPIQKDSDLGGFVVRDVRGVEDGVMRLVCAKDRAVVRLDVALLSEDGPAPPAMAGRYAIYYSLKNAAPDEGELLAKKLAAVIAAHADLPAPKGMTPFVPKPDPGSTL